MILLLAAALELVTLQTLDGREVSVNPFEVASVSEAKHEKDPKKEWAPSIHCVVTMTNGKFVTVVETCDEVRKKLRTPQ
jgi:uncharacterized protein YlzI (FlbEa/FlbD family)